ncbi:MAG: NFACT family protein, partial [Rudaea sp.]
LLARELSFRATGDAGAPSDPSYSPAVHSALVEAWREPARPTLALEEGIPVDFAAFSLSHLAETREVDSMSEALEQFFGSVESYAAVKEVLREQIQAARARLERRRAALERELVSAQVVDQLRSSGEAILAHAHEISRGQVQLQVEDEPGQKLNIPLDPGLTPVENAQKYFGDYRRAKSAAETVPERLREAAADVEFADQVLSDLEDAADRAEIDSVTLEAREAGLLTESRRPRGAPNKPRADFREFSSPDGITVLAGRHARENDRLTFERAHPDDLWLHARGAAGAHVVIVAEGREVPESTVEYAARLAASYSARRDEGGVDVIVAPRRNVKRVRGRAARPGLVTVRGERTVRVVPWRPDR